MIFFTILVFSYPKPTTTQSSFTNCWWWCGGWFKTAAC